jgi:hypothetical protein
MRFRIYLLILGVLLVDPNPTWGADPSAFPPQVELAVIQQLVETCSPQHPRLLVTAKELAELRESIVKDPFRTQLAKVVIARTEQILDEPPVTRDVIGRRLLRTSRRCVSRVLSLAMAFHLTGETRFAERCQAEMLAAARFSDWNPDHFLDVAEMTFALAIGYDWLFAELDESARHQIRAAIVEKGVGLQFADRDNWWITVGNNWGQVCHSGMLAGALVVMEDEPDLATRTIHSAVHNVVPAMQQYAPHGGYPEGPQYWSYGSTYNALLIENLESALGNDFGLSHAPGFSETGGFLALATGPSGQFFNYSDGGSQRKVEPILSWFARRYSRPEWLVAERKRWQELFDSPAEQNSESLRFLPLALLWPVDAETDPTAKLPLNWSSAGSVPVAVLRSSWNDTNAAYVGIKGGSPSASHGHMDSGSFVLESDGVRWSIDLEPEDYHIIESRGMNLWDRGQNSDRWKLLRLNNHGHNTLVIDGQLQNSSGNAPIITFSDNPDWPFTIVDLTDAYRDQVKSARRGVALLPSGQAIIRDEFSGLKPGSRVRWAMISRGEPTGLGTDRVVLNQENQTLALAAISKHSAVWQAIDISTPKNEFDSPNPGTRLLTLEATAPPTGNLTITVLATPGSCSAPSPTASVEVPLSSWPPPHH